MSEMDITVSQSPHKNPREVSCSKTNSLEHNTINNISSSNGLMIIITNQSSSNKCLIHNSIGYNRLPEAYILNQLILLVPDIIFRFANLPGTNSIANSYRNSSTRRFIIILAFFHTIRDKIRFYNIDQYFSRN